MKSSVVEELVAVKVVVNCSQVCVPVVVLLLVAVSISVPPMPPTSTFTVLVVPKIPPGSKIFPTQNDKVC